MFFYGIVKGSLTEKAMFPVIPALGRLRQEDCCVFEASPGYIVVPPQLGLQSDAQSKNK